MMWQPIETAKRDGTKIDVWQRDRRVCDAYWSDIQDAWCVDGDYGPEEPTPLAIFPPVTHWMPIPPKPGEDTPDPLLAKLAEALKQLAELGEIGMKPDYSEWVTFHDRVAQIAREALAEYEKLAGATLDGREHKEMPDG